MAAPNQSPLHRQIARVGRRLFAQSLLNALAWCWAGGLLLAAGWFLLQPLVLDAPPDWLRWAVAGGLLGLGTVLAVVFAVMRAPGRVASALLLDERFGLRERVTTSLTLDPRDEATPAGQALLADVSQRLAGLDVGSRFPVRLSWAAALVPAAAAALAVVALFYEPPQGQANTTADAATADSQPVANAAEVEQKMKQLAKRARREDPADQPKSEKLQELEDELDKIASRPRNTNEEVRERIKEMTEVEDEMKKLQKQLADKDQALKEQLQQMDRLQKKNKDGPADGAEDALAKGDYDKAKEEVDRLAKKMKDKELTEQEKEELRDQLADLQDRLERLSRQQDEKERLEELHRKGELDDEALDRELDRLRQDQKKLKDLEQLAEKLAKCEQCMQDGDEEGAAEQLAEVAKQLEKMGADEQDLEDLKEQLARLQEAKQACSECQGQGQGGEDVQRLTRSQGGKAGRGAGRRPEAKDGKTESFDTRVNPGFDPRGRKEITGYAPGRAYKKKSSVEALDEVKQVGQEAAEAIERQRVPRAASDMARGYFENLAGQKEAEKARKP